MHVIERDAVECALKACIAKGTRRCEFPEKRKVELRYSHNLEELVRFAVVDDALLDRVSGDAEFGKHWEAVRLWSEQEPVSEEFHGVRQAITGGRQR